MFDTARGVSGDVGAVEVVGEVQIMTGGHLVILDLRHLDVETLPTGAATVGRLPGRTK